MLRVSFLAVLLGLLLGGTVLRAQEELEDFDDFDQLFLGELLNKVYTASKHEQDIGESPSAITVITREDIEASGATTIPDLLRMVPGMDVVLCSPFYTSITARLQWNFENNLFLVLVDGREANLELIGWAPWEIQPISLEEVERIEVIRGPASSLYGANAFAGVVSITTRPVSKEPAGWVRLSGGEVASTSFSTGASARIGGWGLAISGGYDLRGRFSDPRDPGNDTWKLRAYAEYKLSESQRLLIDGGMSDGRGITTSAMGSIDFSLTLHSLRVAYESDELIGQVYWSHVGAFGGPEAPLEFAGLRLAEFVKGIADAHTFDAQLQWTLPKFFDPLLIITGGSARASRIDSDDLLDADTFDDITSPHYHQPGIEDWEVRLGAFAHGELEATDWLTITLGTRFDWNNVTGEFLSPRLAAVFKPIKDHFFRVNVARAFRKPGFLEYGIHMMVEFPEDSPITGQDRFSFLEFMTRVAGGGDLEHEDVWSFEAGYLGRFLDGRLTLSWDIYCNLHRNLIEMRQNIVTDPTTGLPDLDQSWYRFTNTDRGTNIFGSELSIRYAPSKYVQLTASWNHRQGFDKDTGDFLVELPKNLLTLGGRFRTESGLVGSLYAFSRSEFTDLLIENPRGLLQPFLQMHMDNFIVVLARLGWRIQVSNLVDVEIGAKLFTPISPFSGPLFRYHEKGGVRAPSGEVFGGDELRRMVIGYLQGSF
jgi:iron complex outermembrane receptor protein